MRCTHAREMMSAGLDGELGTAGRRRLAAHLERCPACRGELARLEQLHALLARAGRHEPRPGLSMRVLAAARSPERRRASWFPAPAQALARAAAFAAVVAIGVVSGTLLAGAPGSGSAHSSALPSFEMFAAAPAASPGGAYLAVLGAAE